MPKRTSTAKSPIKDMPLREPGQSLHLQLIHMMLDTMLPAMVAGMLTSMALMEWVRYFGNSKPNPLLFSAFAVCSLIWAAVAFARFRPRYRAMQQGIRGERAVGQFLDDLRTDGYTVFHDIVGDNFNIDHALIGPAGVFCIETKTHSKPHPQARVTFDGETLLVAGHKLDRCPLTQSRAQVGWLSNQLRESTGKSFHTHGVVVFPGWFVENKGNWKGDVWVMEPKALPAFLRNAPVRMSREDVKLASYHLKRIIRVAERERVEAA